MIDHCRVCGGTYFMQHNVIDDALASKWQLSAIERGYIDRQQGLCCRQCGANLRSIALAKAIIDTIGYPLTLIEIVNTIKARSMSLLEINPAGSLRSTLSRLPLYIEADYPLVDMQRLPYNNDAFDIVVHSDTLEHIADPILALRECRRVLKPGGVLCFTVPIIVNRLTCIAAKDSYHGDDLVCTEFGADVWKHILLAGFCNTKVHCLEWPAALAWSAEK